MLTIRENSAARSKLGASGDDVEELLLRHQRDVDANLQLRRQLQLTRETTAAVEKKMTTYKARIEHSAFLVV